jgi:hypothetical protein
LSHLYTVLKCGSEDGTYNVINEGKSTTVNLLQKTCFRCTTGHQLSLPCRHVISVLLQVSNVLNFVHPAYKIDIIQQFFGCQTIVIPVISMRIKPPPRYNIRNQAESQHVKGSGRRQVRRFASKGEFGGKGKTARTTRVRL